MQPAGQLVGIPVRFRPNRIGIIREMLTADESGVRREARAITAKAIRDGVLVRPERCENGCDARPEAAHIDYTRPLDVLWLCRPCHARFDRGKGRRTGTLKPSKDYLVPVQIYVPRWLVSWASMRARVPALTRGAP